MRGMGWWWKLALGAVFACAVGCWLAPYFANARPIDPIWLRVGGFELRWYGLLLAVAVLVGIGIVLYLNRRFAQLDPDALWFVLIWTVLGGLLGARLMFVLLDWPYYSLHLSQIWQIHEGGMSIHGALLGGAVGLFYSTRRYRLPFWPLTDLISVALPLGQAIGRFGNFFNQEAFGGPTQLPWKMFVAPPFRPTGLEQASYFHPTFLYEAIGDLLIFAVLWWAFPRRLPAGRLALWYLLLYSSWRYVVEWFRVDSRYWGVLTIAQWACLVTAALSAAILIYRYRYEH